MLNKKSIDDLKFENKRVLLRCDFNVPLDKDLNITDNTRLVASIPTIQKISNDNAKLILCSHLGKPKGEPKPELSLKVVASALSKLLNKEVKFLSSDKVIDDNVISQINKMNNGDIVLLENTRYRIEEEKNDDIFSKQLASICDIYVNDAFGTAHRAHSSTAGVAKLVNETAVGYLIQKEIDFLGNAVENPKRPFVAILGGSKVSSKISVINALLEKVDKLIIGGGMAYTFMKAMGHNVGNSLLEEDYLDYCNEMIVKAKDKNVELLLPVDAVIADAFDNNANTKIISTNSDIEDGWMGLDIGPDSEKIFGDAIKDAATIIWNGPMGCFEMPNFASGTIHVARAMAESKAITIIGGGDSAAACNQLGFGDKMTHISTGGGASLEFLEGKELPGISVIQDK